MVYDLLLERFLRYVKINTRSDENATRTPTTQSQVDFALKVLKPELEELGLSNIHYLESNGYLVATLPANDDKMCIRDSSLRCLGRLIGDSNLCLCQGCC